MDDILQEVSHITFNDIDETVALPPKIKEILFEKETHLDIPKCHVVLLDDNDHSYDYVIEMLMKIFGYNSTTAFQMACEVDVLGRVVVYTSNKEHAEYKRDQIMSYGPDWRIDHSITSMSATIELADTNTDTQQ